MIPAFQNLDNSHANCLLFPFFFSASLANVSSKKQALHRLHLEDFWLICSICMWIFWKLYPRCARLYLFWQLFKEKWPAAAVLAQPTGYKVFLASRFDAAWVDTDPIPISWIKTGSYSVRMPGSFLNKCPASRTSKTGPNSPTTSN